MVQLTQAQFDLTVDWLYACNEDQDCKLHFVKTRIYGSRSDLYTLFERMSRIAELCDEEGNWRQREVAKRVCEKLRAASH